MCGALGGILGSVLSLGKKDSTPTPTVSTAPTVLDSGADSLQAEKDAKKKQASAQGYQSTIKTGSTGDMSTATTKKTLLGS